MNIGIGTTIGIGLVLAGLFGIGVSLTGDFQITEYFGQSGIVTFVLGLGLLVAEGWSKVCTMKPKQERTDGRKCIICGFDVEEHNAKQTEACYRIYDKRYPLTLQSSDSGGMK